MGNKGHKQAVGNIMAERSKKNRMARKNLFSISEYFGAKKKKDKTNSTAIVAATHLYLGRSCVLVRTMFCLARRRQWCLYISNILHY